MIDEIILRCTWSLENMAKVDGWVGGGWVRLNGEKTFLSSGSQPGKTWYLGECLAMIIDIFVCYNWKAATDI